MLDSYDVVVIGGGCSGLSLATRLAGLGTSSPATLVLEERSAYAHDRIWCSFKDPEAPPQAAICHAWDTMRVTGARVGTSFNCTVTPYQMVHSGEFYRISESTITQSTQVHLKMASSIIKKPVKHKGMWQIESTTGTVEARYIVDTRPRQRPERDGAKLWQSFYGQEIECDADVFDSSYGDLMDFSAATACGAQHIFPEAVCFVYVLPTSSRQALVEFTVFGPDPLSPDLLSELCLKAIAQRVGDVGFTVLRTEHGMLPMGVRSLASDNDPSYVFAGLTAGGARPSSGYAFSRIQRWAADCADALALQKAPLGHAKDSLVLRAMDALFLKVVRSRPHAAPDLFAALFAAADTQSVIRFMSDRATLIDYCHVAASLLPGPLLQAFAGGRGRAGRVPPLVEAQ